MAVAPVQVQVAFTQFVARHARAQAQANPAGVRYGLNTMHATVPVTADLLSQFINDYNNKQAKDGSAYILPALGSNENSDVLLLAQNLGLLGETAAAKDGTIECSIVYPDYNADQATTANTASVYGLQAEMESHIGLLFNCVEKGILAANLTKKGSLLSAAQQQNIHHNISKVKIDVQQVVSHEVLLLQAQWLAEKTGSSDVVRMTATNAELAAVANGLFRAYIVQADNKDKAYQELNSFLAKSREKVAESVRNQAFQSLQAKGLLALGQEEKIILQLKSTPATYADTIVQNSATGKLTHITASEHTAHKKKFGADKIALVRILQEDGSVLWRVPSIAPTGEKRKTHAAYIKDTKEKIAYMVKTIKEQAGDPGQLVNYNLLTSYDSERTTDNHQSWSTEIIIEAAHQFNKEQIAKNPDTTDLMIINNISVNQWGITRLDQPVERNKQGIADEIFTLAELSLLQSLKTQLCSPGSRLSQSEQTQLSAAADISLEKYKNYLSDPRKPEYYTQSLQADKQREVIADLKLGDLESRASNDAETPAQKAASVLLVLLTNGMIGEREHGMLIQALNLMVETNKVSGCKSANERFGATADLSVAAKEAQCLAAMDNFLNSHYADDGVFNLHSVAKLTQTVLTVFNENHLTEDAGMRVSLNDQGAVSKAEHYDPAMVNVTHVTHDYDMVDSDDDELAYSSGDAGRNRTDSSSSQGVGHTGRDRAGSVRASVSIRRETMSHIRKTDITEGGNIVNTNAFLSELVTRWQKGGSALQAHVFEAGKWWKKGSGGGLSNTFAAVRETQDFKSAVDQLMGNLNNVQGIYAKGPGAWKTVKRTFTKGETVDADCSIRAGIAQTVRDQLGLIAKSLDPLNGPQDTAVLKAQVSALQESVTDTMETQFAHNDSEKGEKLNPDSSLYKSLDMVKHFCNEFGIALDAEQRTRANYTGVVDEKQEAAATQANTNASLKT